MKRIAFFAAVLLGIAALFFCCRGGGIGAIGGGMAGGGRPGRNAVERLNDNQVFLKQEEPGSCTLCAAAMMLRRAAILSGDRRFWRIDEGEIKEEAWVEGQGLKHSFSYGEFQVEHEELPGGKENAPLLERLLREHPEGIVLYYGPGKKQHAVLLTDYTDGVFYCADPWEGKNKGRIPLEEAAYVTAENARAYWYVVWRQGL